MKCLQCKKSCTVSQGQQLDLPSLISPAALMLTSEAPGLSPQRETVTLTDFNKYSIIIKNQSDNYKLTNHTEHLRVAKGSDMTIYSKQMDDEGAVERFEAEFRAKGYRKVEKTNDQPLKPLEYIKNSWSGSRDSFEGATHYEITWRSPD